MKIGIDINCQFVRMTGVQFYVDSLLDALYALDSPHEIVAFAPALSSPEMWHGLDRDGLFAWRRQPRARVDAAGSDFRLQDAPLLTALPRARALAAPVDHALVRRLKGRTLGWRSRRAGRRYDLMHLPAANVGQAPDVGARHSTVTIYDLTTMTCPWAHRPDTIQAWAALYAFARSKCARVLTISEFSKADIVEHLGIPADRVDVTPLAPRSTARRVTDPAQTAPVLNKFGLAGAPFVLYSGSLEPRKNLARLVEAFAQAVQEARLPDHKLALAGGAWGSHADELRARAAELGVGGRLVLPGYVSNDEMNALMSSCAAFAYVSEYEGFGMPPLEAMACGAPVVASNTTSLPEVVGDAAILVDPVDVGAIAGALHRLLTDGAESARRRALSLGRAALFSWERTARLTLQSYEAAAL